MPLQRSEWTDEARRALGPLADRDPLDNVFGTFIRHPDLFRRYSPLGVHILTKSSLSARDRELAILRIGSRNECAYEFAQHTEIGVAIGMTADEIAGIHIGPQAAVWSAFERLLLRAVDELVSEHRIGDDTWTELRQSLTEHQMMDLVFTVGTYNMISWALNSFGVELDDRFSDQ